jgi:hypothetical protein
MTLSDDDLRAMLRRIDPMAEGDAAATPRATAPRPRLGRLAPGVAAVVLLAGAGALVWASDGGGPQYAASLELSVAPSSGVMASCLPFSVTELAHMPMAFEATVVEQDAGAVTLDVDR